MHLLDSSAELMRAAGRKLNRMEANTSRRELRFSERVPIPFPAPPVHTSPPPSKASNAFGPVDSHLQRLEQLASVGTISAGLAHEIKNAMVAIRTFVDLLLDRNKDAELAEIVKSEIVRIDSLVSQMLGFAATSKRSPSEMHLNDALNRALRLIDPQLSARNIRLKKRLRASLDTIEGDSHQFDQAFINILLNAIEAIGSDGELNVSTSVARNTKPLLRITINNTGPVIPPEQLSRIFEPFYTTKANGTGLGPSITRQIIEQHGGTISVDSQADKGTTFEITLPLKQDARQ